jgi:CHASE2 domain-containing sensor protein
MNPFNFLRVLLAALSILFAYQLGRVGTELKMMGRPLTKATTWFLRVLVTAFAIFWVGGWDVITIVTLVLIAVAFGVGVWNQFKPKRDDGVHLDLQ